MSASHKKSSLEQMMLRKMFLIILNDNAKAKRDKQDVHPLCGALTSASIEVEDKIAKVFFECFMEILQLQRAKASTWGLDCPPITALNCVRYQQAFYNRDNTYRDDMKEMLQALTAVRNKVALSLGYP